MWSVGRWASDLIVLIAYGAFKQVMKQPFEISIPEFYEACSTLYLILSHISSELQAQGNYCIGYSTRNCCTLNKLLRDTDSDSAKYQYDFKSSNLQNIIHSG